MDKLTAVLPKSAIEAYSWLRSSVYFAESLPLVALSRLLGTTHLHSPRPSDLDQKIIKAIAVLFREDAENIKSDVYPLTVLKPESPLAHGKRFAKIVLDSIGVSKRKKNRTAHNFSRSAQKNLQGLPEYYTRNFHFQTDGYLSATSAEIYDHQVEILFRGASHAMRRSIVKPIKAVVGARIEPRILELASGDGSATRALALAIPQARITCVDLSDAYLKKAQVYLKDLDRINFVQGNAAETPFQSESFDAVTSVFLFHELPFEERARVFKEAFRVLKPGGVITVMDSLQMGDDTGFAWALKQFPQDFHEPFYKNYVENPLEELVRSAGFLEIKTSTHFFSKLVTATKF